MQTGTIRLCEERGLRFLPTYHMNKKTWTAIILDGTVTVSRYTVTLNGAG